MKIQGTIVNGEAAASGQKMNWNGGGSIYHQVEFLKKYHQSFAKKLSASKMATINVNFKNKISISKWQYTFDRVYWLPTSDTWYEKISFLPIIFIYKNNHVKAWLYKAYKSPHKDDVHLVEVIAPYIENLNTYDICEIEIDQQYT